MAKSLRPPPGVVMEPNSMELSDTIEDLALEVGDLFDNGDMNFNFDLDIPVYKNEAGGQGTQIPQLSVPDLQMQIKTVEPLTGSVIGTDSTTVQREVSTNNQMTGDSVQPSVPVTSSKRKPASSRSKTSLPPVCCWCCVS